MVYLEPPPRSPSTSHQPLDRMMLKLIPRLQNLRMHLLHSIAQLDTKPPQNLLLPGIVLGIHPALHLLIVDHAHAKALLCLGGVKGCACLFDFGEELLPVGEVLAESVEDVFGFEIPE